MLAFDCGAGKTGATLTAIRQLLDSFEVRKVLIVAPLFVAEVTWPDEIAEWEHTAALSWTLLRASDSHPEVAAIGDAARAEAFAKFEAEFEAARLAHIAAGMGKGAARAAAKASPGLPGPRADAVQAAVLEKARETVRRRLLAEDTEIHIINREALPWLWEATGNGALWPYDMVVLDESTLAKNGKMYVAGKVDDSGVKRRGQLSRFGVLAKARPKVKHMVLLTGTPTPKGVPNLWGQGYLIDLGRRLGRTKRDFEMRWIDTDRWSRKSEPKPHAEAEIMGLMKDVMFSLGPDDYGELPPMVSPPVKVRLSGQIMARYKEFARTQVSLPYDVEAVNRGVLTNKLLQFANGSMYQESGDDIWVHDEKLDALVEIVEASNGAPILVAYNFKFDFARIRRKYPNLVVLNEENPRDVMKRWNAGEIEMLAAHRASAGHGLNMQYGGNIAVQYGLTHDLELYHQFNKRLHRSGQTKTVFNHHIIAENTIDELILPLFIEARADIQNRILESVRILTF